MTKIRRRRGERISPRLGAAESAYIDERNNRIMKLKIGSVPAVLLLLLCGATVARAQFTFDRPKTEGPLPNPYTIAATREQIIKTARDVLKTCGIPLDDEATRDGDGRIVTKYVVYTRGVTARTDLEHLASLPASDVRNWLRGRYALEITALPLDEKRSQIKISARIKGREAGVVEGERWVDGTSNGTLEDEVLRGLAGKILGLDMSLERNSRRLILNCEYK
jgi:hypothetical protein